MAATTSTGIQIHLHDGSPIRNDHSKSAHWIELGGNACMFATAEAAETLIMVLRAHIESLNEDMQLAQAAPDQRWKFHSRSASDGSSIAVRTQDGEDNEYLLLEAVVRQIAGVELR